MQPWVMRPCRSTCVASTTTMPAPELASIARCPRCQSVAEPSSELYWHIGATWMRLVISTEPSLMGEKSADMDFPDGVGGARRCGDHKDRSEAGKLSFGQRSAARRLVFGRSGTARILSLLSQGSDFPSPETRGWSTGRRQGLARPPTDLASAR